MATIILKSSANPLKWQRSSDSEQSWTDIACTNFFYTETDTLTGRYTYRALQSDSTYSDSLHITYVDTIPSVANTLPLSSASKMVDDTVTLSLDIPDSQYSYQWYKGNAIVSGATGSVYSIKGLRSADSGVYKCRIWNGCNSIYSEETMLIVEKSQQAITLPAAMAKAYGEDFDLPATTSKGLTIAYSSSNAGVATVSGSRIHITGAGVTTITATQAGNSDYRPATAATLQLTVSMVAQQITFAALPEKTYGDAAFMLTATASSGLPVSYASSNPAVATVSGSLVTIVG
ncbi:MAG: immunoglobulin domain-containing protein, partial [Prevotellaceae bacterium]|nr:immunoglobulin domain-containing protein [Prevotellaceae bacterium]